MRYPALALSLLIAGGTAPAAAQDVAQPDESAIETPIEAGEPEKEIIVEAPRALPGPKVIGKSYTGAPIVMMTMRIPVLYGDLDLADEADAARLMDRVENVARDACRELDTLYPLSEPDSGCVLETMKRSRPAADAVIAAAKEEAAEHQHHHMH